MTLGASSEWPVPIVFVSQKGMILTLLTSSGYRRRADLPASLVTFIQHGESGVVGRAASHRGWTTGYRLSSSRLSAMCWILEWQRHAVRGVRNTILRIVVEVERVAVREGELQIVGWVKYLI